MQTELKLKKNNFLENKSEVENAESPIWKRFIIYAVFLLIAFLLGLIPMWLSERETSEQRDAAQTNLRLSTMQNRLASAAINVRRGEYEEARLAASNFFTDLRSEIDRRESAFSDGQKEGVKPILAQRDDLITLLARNDPSTGDRLAEMYLTYVQVVKIKK